MEKNMNLLDTLILNSFNPMFMAQDAAGLLNRLAGWIDGLQVGGVKILHSLAIVMLIAAGVAWMAGRQGAQWAKSTLGRVIIGLGVGTLAIDITMSILGTLK